MSNDQPSIPFPNLLSTPERLRARFNVLHQVRNIISVGGSANITQADYDRYTQLYPLEADRLHRMQKLRTLTGYATVAGFLGGGLGFLRVTRNPPLILVGLFLGTTTSHLVADDIGSWIYGTYKFDNAGTNERFVEWVKENKQD